VRTLDVTIETNTDGDNVVVFPARKEDIDPPFEYEEKLEWIRLSVDTFLRHVREIDDVRRALAVY
jgi:hypothetical protein